MASINVISWAKRLLCLGLLASLLAGCAGLSINPLPEPVALRFVYIDKVADFAPLAEDFHRQHPNITVELVGVPTVGNVSQSLVEKLKDADAIRLSSSFVTPEIAATFMPLETQISTSQDFPSADLIAGSLDALKMDGKQYGIPAGISPMVVFYIPKKFNDAGVKPPLPNWTLADFVTTASALNRTDETLRGSNQLTYGYCSYPTFPDVAIFTYLFGGGLFDNLYQVSNPTLNLSANVDALSWYASLSNDFGLIPPAHNEREVGMLVARENCAFWIDWLDRSMLGDHTADPAAPLPLPGYHAQFNVANLDAYFIISKSAHPDETWQWINFLMQQQSASGNLIPPLKSEINAQEYAARAPQNVVAVARSLPPQTVMLGLEMYRNQRFSKVLQLFGQAATQVFQGNADAQSALDAAQRQAESAFSQP